MTNEEKKNAALRSIDESPVRARQTWRHNKTDGVYMVVAVGLHEPTFEPVVAYSGYDGVVWMRALAVFLGAHADGQQRFTQIDDLDVGATDNSSYRHGTGYGREVSK